ncbi:hypothetical protein NEIPOLOT_01601 [Neisseria polysaccharea ATCC 43768]|nr:hypothetical protein NEIPOLOT_01601 [Neisseria polysaccharea ATCC 43768]
MAGFVCLRFFAVLAARVHRDRKRKRAKNENLSHWKRLIKK